MSVSNMGKPKSAEDMVRIQKSWDFIVDCQQIDDDTKNTDVHLGCPDGLVPAHSCILAAYSSVLRDLFLGQGPEYYGIRTILLPDYKIADIERMIQLIYCGSTAVKSFTDARQLALVLEDFKISGREDLNYNLTTEEEAVHIMYYVSGKAIVLEPVSGPPPEPRPASTEDDEGDVQIIEEPAGPPLPLVTVERIGHEALLPVHADSTIMEPDTSPSDPEPESGPGEPIPPEPITNGTPAGTGTEPRSADEELAGLSKKRRRATKKASLVPNKERVQRAGTAADEGSPEKRSLRSRDASKANCIESDSEAERPRVGWKGPRTRVRDNYPRNRMPAVRNPVFQGAAVGRAKPAQPMAASFFRSQQEIYAEANVCRGCDTEYDNPKSASDCITDRHQLVRCYFCFGCFGNTELLFEHYGSVHERAERAGYLVCPFCQQSVPIQIVSTHVITNHIFDKRNQQNRGGHSGVRAPVRPPGNVPQLQKPTVVEAEKPTPNKKPIITVNLESVDEQ